MEKTTKVKALIKLMELDHEAWSWTQIYRGIERQFPHFTTPKDWKAGIRGVLYREIRNGRTFKKVGEGTFALLRNDCPCGKTLAEHS